MSVGSNLHLLIGAGYRIVLVDLVGNQWVVKAERKGHHQTVVGYGDQLREAVAAAINEAARSER